VVVVASVLVVGGLVVVVVGSVVVVAGSVVVVVIGVALLVVGLTSVVVVVDSVVVVDVVVVVATAPSSTAVGVSPAQAANPSARTNANVASLPAFIEVTVSGGWATRASDGILAGQSLR